MLENDAFKSDMTALTNSKELPDIYNTWGGGVLERQVDAGLVEDITDSVEPWVDTLVHASRTAYEFDGKMYADTFGVGAVGFSYD